VITDVVKFHLIYQMRNETVYPGLYVDESRM